MKFTRLKPLAVSCSILLSTLAHVGHDTAEQTETAFRQGGMALGLAADDLELVPLAQCDLMRLEEALDELGEASTEIRNLMLNACLQTISADGAIRIKEVELLRAIADSLGCPVPPVATFEPAVQAA